MASLRAPYPIIGQYNVQRDIAINGQRTINMYAIPANDTIQKLALVPASGFENPIIVGVEGTIRAQFVYKETMYVVVYDSIYSYDTALAPTFIGNLTTTNGYVGVTANEKQVVFCDNVNIYVYTISPPAFAIAVLPSPPTIAPKDIKMLDNYIILIDDNSIQWRKSALNDALTWNALDFANFISTPDQLVASAILKRRLYLFGKISTEVWYDAGSADFPFRRDNNALFEHGCVSPWTVQEGFELLFYVARNEDGPAGVMMVDGVSNPKKISTPAIDLFLQNTQAIEDGQAILYQENGLIFYQLSFTQDAQTFLYVVNTNAWHELGMPNGNRHPASTHAFFNNKHYIGMYDENKFYEMSYKFFTYRDELIRCEIIGAPFYNQNHTRIRVDRFELEALNGIPDGTLPNQIKYSQLDNLVKQNLPGEAILYVSRDSGRTFGYGRRQSTGKLGDYLHRTLWNRLGVYRGRRIVFKIEFPYKIPFIVIGAYIVYEDLEE